MKASENEEQGDHLSGKP